MTRITRFVVRSSVGKEKCNFWTRCAYFIFVINVCLCVVYWSIHKWMILLTTTVNQESLFYFHHNRCQYDKREIWDLWKGTFSFILGGGWIMSAILYGLGLNRQRRWSVREQEECIIEVMAFGVQLTESTITIISDKYQKEQTQKRTINSLQFIPKEDIKHVLICEVVYSYKVLSVVMFRLDQKLHPAISPKQMELTYQECENLWEKLRKVL